VIILLMSEGETESRFRRRWLLLTNIRQGYKETWGNIKHWPTKTGRDWMR